MKEKTEKIFELKCMEAYTRDVGRGVARIDYDSMDTLNASTGDVIEIKGKRRTVAKCLPLYPSDEGKGIIRIDGLGRNNSGIAIGDTIAVRKIKAVDAEKIVVAQLESIPPIDERYLADALESVPLIKGDNVMVPYFGGRLSFSVQSTVPKNTPVIIQKNTVFVIKIKKEYATPTLQCKYCYKEVTNEKLQMPFCGIDHKIRWTIRDELKNIGIKEVKIE